MAMSRSPVGPLILGATSLTTNNTCTICDEELNFGIQDCYKIITCSHIFHVSCIEKHLSSAASCPTCHKTCELSDLKKYPPDQLIGEDNTNTHHIIAGSAKPTKNTGRGKCRGALAHRPNTRSLSKNLFQDNNTSLELNYRPNLNTTHTTDPFSPNARRTIVNDDLQTQQEGQEFTRTSNLSKNNKSLIEIDYNRIEQIIENTIAQKLQDMNLMQSQPSPLHASMANQLTNVVQNPPPHSSNSPCSRPKSLPNSEKVTSIIQSWNVKFDGSTNGLTVEEFLYRIKSLTAEHFNSNFDLICKNLNILLTNKAHEWFWRYHKQVEYIEWNSFCVALKAQYKDLKSKYDKKEEIRNRKMKPGESFEAFYDSICYLMDRMDQTIEEDELVEILVRNLRPDIRHELLYVPILSVAHLRRLVQMRENLLSEDSYKRIYMNKSQAGPNLPARRNVAEVEEENCQKNSPFDCVEAVSQTAKVYLCWNCDGTGHFWDDCVQERRVFCYGCGAKNMYKPNCLKCSAKKVSKNFMRQNSIINPP